MIVLGEVQSYSRKRMKIATYNGAVEILFNEGEAAAIPYAVGDKVVLDAPCARPGAQIDYSKSIKIARTPFKWVSDIKKDWYCDMIALCNEYKPLVKTKGTDFLFSIVLVDQTGTVELKVFIDQAHYDRVIASNKGEPFKRGDVLLVRNIKRGGSSTTAVTTKPCIISKIAGCDVALPPSPEASFVEWATARFILDNCTTPSMRAVLSRKVPLPFSSAKMRTISEITDKSFFNIIGKVIHCDPDQEPTISITDFTVSDLIAPGVGLFPNNMVLVIRLFGQHLAYLKKVKARGYYMFENIRIHAFGELMEAYMHDNLQGSVTPIADDLVLADIRTREEAFHSRPEAGRGERSSGGGERSSSGVDIPRPPVQEVPPRRPVAVQQIRVASSTGEVCRLKELPRFCGSENIPSVQIAQMVNPGIFLCICRVKEIVRPADLQTASTVVTVVNYGVEFRLRTKKNLNQKLMGQDIILVGHDYKCLILRSGQCTLFLVDIFANDKEYFTFIEFYGKAIYK